MGQIAEPFPGEATASPQPTPPAAIEPNPQPSRRLRAFPLQLLEERLPPRPRGHGDAKLRPRWVGLEEGHDQEDQEDHDGDEE